MKLDEEGQKIPGIGDVYAILARVYSGPQFTWIEAGFPEDDTKAYSYLHTAIRKGSAIAILQAITAPTPLPMYSNGGITTSYHRLKRWLMKVNHLPLSVS